MGFVSVELGSPVGEKGIPGSGTDARGSLLCYFSLKPGIWFAGYCKLYLGLTSLTLYTFLPIDTAKYNDIPSKDRFYFDSRKSLPYDHRTKSQFSSANGPFTIAPETHKSQLQGLKDGMCWEFALYGHTSQHILPGVGFPIHYP